MLTLVRSILVLSVLFSGAAVAEMIAGFRLIRSRIQWSALFFPAGAFLVMSVTVLADLWSSDVFAAHEYTLLFITLFLAAGAVFGVAALLRLMRAQQERADENEFLRVRYEKLFKGNDLPILVSESDCGLVVDANQAAERLFEMPSSELCARDMSGLGFEADPCSLMEVGTAGEDLTPSLRHRSPAGLERDLVIHRSVVEVGESHLDYDIIEDVTERNAARRELEEQKNLLAHLADHDALTGLPNRRVLDVALERAIARSKRGTASALLFLDVDNFKSINDEEGHEAGDAALIAIARLLTNGVRMEDIVVRLGGDEFAVLLEMIRLSSAVTIGQRLIDTLQESFPRLGLSIGAVDLQRADDALEALRRADQRMYAAKNNGKNQVVAD